MAFPQIDTPSAGKLTAEDFPAWPARRVEAMTATDEQIESLWSTSQPMAAEACTDVEACSPPITRWGIVLVLLGWPIVAVAVAGCFAVLWPA